MCPVSCVRCHGSHVTCHLSPITCPNFNSRLVCKSQKTTKFQQTLNLNKNCISYMIFDQKSPAVQVPVIDGEYTILQKIYYFCLYRLCDKQTKTTQGPIEENSYLHICHMKDFRDRQIADFLTLYQIFKLELTKNNRKVPMN